jgi:hypothetical protein
MRGREWKAAEGCFGDTLCHGKKRERGGAHVSDNVFDVVTREIRKVGGERVVGRWDNTHANIGLRP